MHPFSILSLTTDGERVFFMRKGKRRPLMIGAALALVLLAVVLLSERDMRLDILADTTAPEITGIHDLTVRTGDAVAYRSGITVTDDRDAAPVLHIDSSEVDLGTPGTYEVVYEATDAAGNAVRETATVTVVEETTSIDENAYIDEAIDEKLNTILSPGMTAREQVEAIYRWARSSLSYSGHSDKTDYVQAGYVMLTSGRGDCFGYFAVTKLMFERLGISNIDVQKVKNHAEDSNHYWSLVSVDGGETYYHFDATPRMGEGDDFCLVTDEFLDAYSAAHKNSHNRDRSRYPATPEDAQ